jgi:hypothetical protein
MAGGELAVVSPPPQLLGGPVIDPLPWFPSSLLKTESKTSVSSIYPFFLVPLAPLWLK